MYGNCLFRDFLLREKKIRSDLTHCEPYGSFETGRQSIGSTKAAFVLRC
jgi:hypothetical protein